MSISHGIDAGLLMSQTMASTQTSNATSKSQDQEKIKELAQEFEAIFIQQMYKEMRKTIDNDGLVPRTSSEEMFIDMQDLEAARDTARQGGIGLAEMMLKQLQQID